MVIAVGDLLQGVDHLLSERRRLETAIVAFSRTFLFKDEGFSRALCVPPNDAL